jgi:hypothetical protein
VHDETDRDEFEVVAEGVVEVEGGLARWSGPGRPGDEDAVVEKALLPSQEAPGRDCQGDVRVHGRDSRWDALGIFEQVQAWAAGECELQVGGVVSLDVR